MEPREHIRPGGKVFIAGLRFFEIVYLPATEEIVSRVDGAGPVAEHVETGEVLPGGEDEDSPEES